VQYTSPFFLLNETETWAKKQLARSRAGPQRMSEVGRSRRSLARRYRARPQSLSGVRRASTSLVCFLFFLELAICTADRIRANAGLDFSKQISWPCWIPTKDRICSFFYWNKRSDLDGKNIIGNNRKLCTRSDLVAGKIKELNSNKIYQDLDEKYNLDFYDSDLRKEMQKQTRSATKTQERCNLGYGKTKNPNFFFGFFWIGLKTKMNCKDEFVDAHRVNRGNLIPR
jgi:hypothetical protein